jgi:hypothetical protein
MTGVAGPKRMNYEGVDIAGGLVSVPGINAVSGTKVGKGMKRSESENVS